MRITSFWAKGYRSLRDVRIDGLGPFNVFYGPNGAGKSNILAAMQTLFAILVDRTQPEAAFQLALTDHHEWSNPFVIRHERCHIGECRELQLGAEIAWSNDDPVVPPDWRELASATVEVTYDWDTLAFSISCLSADMVDFRELLQRVDREGLLRSQQNVHRLAQYAFALVDAARFPRREQLVEQELDVPMMLASGRFKEALLRARQHPEVTVRRRYKQFEDLMTGEPFHRPPFEMTHDPTTNQIDLVEVKGTDAYNSVETPIDLTGLGVAQLYTIIAQTLLSGARSVGLEEPEAHIHAPTTGIQLRGMLERLVNEGYIDQLFIATHSNLFDLDPDKYYDVAFDAERGTTVSTKPLIEIDRRHLYEPGPAKHALRGLLRYVDPETVMFRRPDGAPVSAREMLDMLQRDDPIARAFLQDVVGAAVEVVGLESEPNDNDGDDSDGDDGEPS